MKFLLLGLLIYPQVLVFGQIPFWDTGHLGTLSPLNALPWLGNPASHQPFSIHVQFQPTIPGFTQMGSWVMGQKKNMGWHGLGGYIGNELLSQKYLHGGISGKINRIQLGGRFGFHALHAQDLDFQNQYLVSAELGAYYQMSSRWQTGFWAGGNRWSQFWRMGLGFKPTSTWQVQTEWQGRVAFSTQYAWRPGWQIHLGTTHKIFRSGITWQSEHWTANATLCRWPMGLISTLYTLRYQP